MFSSITFSLSQPPHSFSSPTADKADKPADSLIGSLYSAVSLPLSFPLSPLVSLCSSGQFPFRQFGT